jgi:hypothetical protein
LGGQGHLWVGLGHKWTTVNTMIWDMTTKIGVGKIDVSNQLAMDPIENLCMLRGDAICSMASHNFIERLGKST